MNGNTLIEQKISAQPLEADICAKAVSGADHIDTRPGFKTMMERLLSNGVKTIIVETANGFARDLMGRRSATPCSRSAVWS